MSFIPVLIALLLQQTPQPPQTIKPEDRASIAGFIVKMGPGEPLSKATVSLTPVGGGRGQGYSVTTTSTGQFIVPNLNPGQYRLSATRNGYVRMEFGARAPNRSGLTITLT